LFVCVKNGGKSQMAAGLMRQVAGESVTIRSAGTRAGSSLNALSVEALAELGVDIAALRPTQLTDALVRAADLVVVLGSEAEVESVGGTPVEVWETDEPSLRGIEGIERMRLVRDDIAGRVRDLATRLTRPDATSATLLELPGTVVRSTELEIPHRPVPDDQAVGGAPTTGSVELGAVGNVQLGVWEMPTGTMTDVETDEVFVVVAGRATVEVEGIDQPLHLVAGSVGRLQAGMRTRWTVTEPLRKVYLLGG
jgi:arsenate-mycothiol transferase